MQSPTPVASASEVLSLMSQHFKANIPILAFYSSDFDRIITDQHLMVIPIYNRQIHRAHSIFDTVDIFEDTLLLFDEHLARMEISCKLAGIDLPMSLELIKKKIIDIASFCINKYGLQGKPINLRFWVSSGGENFGILPSGKPVFYLAAFLQPPEDTKTLRNEFSVPEVEAKKGILAISKTTNYLVNSLVASAASKKGGNLGIMVSKEGIVLEAPISNVAFIWKNGDFVTSKFDKVLKGTTLVECMKLIDEELIPKGIVRSIVQRDFTLQEVYDNAVEMMLIGGNYIIPVGRFDGRVISTETGKVTKHLQEGFLRRMREKAEKVPLDLYRHLMKSNL